MNKKIQGLLEHRSQSLEHKANEYSPLALAYIGDAVYEIFIRTYVLNKGNAPVNKLHKASREMVRASAQAKLYYIIEPELSEEEKDVLRRGRNAKSMSTPKNADMTEYRHATGLEALIGYLYIQGNINRISQLIDLGMDKLLEENK
ncbi:MAG: ribonuclease [Clostridia bacterium]|jgi:ribonuclease-3 family protein|nr:ribonuclease [Clostridia bacterium]